MGILIVQIQYAREDPSHHLLLNTLLIPSNVNILLYRRGIMLLQACELHEVLYDKNNLGAAYA